MAGAPPHEPARPRRRSRHLAAPSELSRKRACRAVARDDHPAVRAARYPAAPAQPAAAGGRLRARLRREPARRSPRSRRPWTPCAWSSRATSRTRPSRSTATGTWWRPTARSRRCSPTSPSRRCSSRRSTCCGSACIRSGLAPRIVNLAEWRAHLLERLRRQNETFADPGARRTGARAAVLSGRRDADAARSTMRAPPSPTCSSCALATLTLSLISTITVFGTPLDVTLSELAIESLLPRRRGDAHGAGEAGHGFGVRRLAWRRPAFPVATARQHNAMTTAAAALPCWSWRARCPAGARAR